jgi:hypothetical protein
MGLTAAELVVVEEIVAKVNGDIVTRSDLEKSRLGLLEDLKRRNLQENQVSEVLKERGQHLLRDRIDTLLLIQKGSQLSVNVDQELSKYMSEIMLQYKVADQDKFAQVVREQTGMRFEDFKPVKNNMVTQRVLSREVGSRIVIPREGLKYYEEHKRVHAREGVSPWILVSARPDPGLPRRGEKGKGSGERARRGEIRRVGPRQFRRGYGLGILVVKRAS